MWCVRPAQECAKNGRARSTKMRWAVRSQWSWYTIIIAIIWVFDRWWEFLLHLYGRNPPAFSGMRNLDISSAFFFPWYSSGIYVPSMTLVSGIRKWGKSVDAVCPLLFFSSRSAKTYLGVGAVISRPDGTIPDKARKWWGTGSTRAGIKTTVRTSMGNILFHNSIVEKMQKLCYNASACFTKNTRLFT